DGMVTSSLPVGTTTPVTGQATALPAQFVVVFQSVLVQPTQTLVPSTNVACALMPDVPPSAVSTNRVPRSFTSGANVALVKFPNPSAIATQLLSCSSSGSSCSVIVTTSLGAQPLPVIVTGEPGE